MFTDLKIGSSKCGLNILDYIHYEANYFQLFLLTCLV